MSHKCIECLCIIPAWDSHPLCVAHRSCSRSEQCQAFCVGLSQEHFDALETGYQKGLRTRNVPSITTGKSGRMSTGSPGGHPRKGVRVSVTGDSTAVSATVKARPEQQVEKVGENSGNTGLVPVEYAVLPGKSRENSEVASELVVDKPGAVSGEPGVSVSATTQRLTVNESAGAFPASVVDSLEVSSAVTSGNFGAITSQSVVTTVAGLGPYAVRNTGGTTSTLRHVEGGPPPGFPGGLTATGINPGMSDNSSIHGGMNVYSRPMNSSINTSGLAGQYPVYSGMSQGYGQLNSNTYTTSVGMNSAQQVLPPNPSMQSHSVFQQGGGVW